jgi:hypothetical protein
MGQTPKSAAGRAIWLRGNANGAFRDAAAERWQKPCAAPRKLC